MEQAENHKKVHAVRGKETKWEMSGEMPIKVQMP
jgi:hypothetical protein